MAGKPANKAVHASATKVGKVGKGSQRDSGRANPGSMPLGSGGGSATHC
jgi:hypothetical protein